MKKYGVLEWDEEGCIVRKEFAAVVTVYPSGVIGPPQPFHGRMILATDTTERPLLVLCQGSELANRGVISKRGWWLLPKNIIQQRVGLFAWAFLLGAAVYKNLSHFFGF
jgi:hypothetical protein